MRKREPATGTPGRGGWARGLAGLRAPVRGCPRGRHGPAGRAPQGGHRRPRRGRPAGARRWGPQDPNRSQDPARTRKIWLLLVTGGQRWSTRKWGLNCRETCPELQRCDSLHEGSTPSAPTAGKAGSVAAERRAPLPAKPSRGDGRLRRSRSGRRRSEPATHPPQPRPWCNRGDPALATGDLDVQLDHRIHTSSFSEPVGLPDTWRATGLRPPQLAASRR